MTFERTILDKVDSIEADDDYFIDAWFENGYLHIESDQKFAAKVCAAIEKDKNIICGIEVLGGALMDEVSSEFIIDFPLVH